ncbi:alpha/beta fold hydrolase [Fodinicola feengrottensis]|uniref:alpha/beta fold hydrolase n=1 Tax=Fodinicola feengrottensis TaxID=435914 RepID=UPI0024425083|nr:alpha/beta fold hydrolase [Fodinicola feengrottensis]
MTGVFRRQGRRRKAVSVLVAAALIALSGCGARAVTGDFSPGPASSGQAAGGPPVAPVAWKPCPDVIADVGQGQADARFSYSCGTVTVPQDWAKPTGPTFQLELLRVRSKNQTNRIGSLLVNPGGPGASGLGLAVDLAGSIPAAVTGRFDLVGFDPRGIGRSAPVRCIPNPVKDQSTEQTVDPVSQSEFDQQVTLSKRIGQLCQQAYPNTLGLFSTEQTARDLDAIRAGVGDSKITYLGFSYGTELGAVYAHLFPANIRAFVLTARSTRN